MPHDAAELLSVLEVPFTDPWDRAEGIALPRKVPPVQRSAHFTGHATKD
ncbi:MAG: hypothetical protein WBS16_06895 [Thermoplasmata archaeon]